MAKRKKLQDNNPPRRVEIRGQDHLLAYITPEEAQLLMDNGGAGEPGPMGIPAFFDVGEGAGGYDSGGEGDDEAADTAGGRGDPDAGIGGGGSTSGVSAGGGAVDFGSFRGSSEEEDASLQQDIAAAAAIASGVQGLGDYSFDRGSLGGLLEAQTYKDLLSGQGLNLGGFSPLANRQAIMEAQRAVMGVDPYQTALSQIPGRMEQAKAGYGMPGGFGAAMGAMGQFTLGRMQKALDAGGRPVFDAQGQLKGVFSEGPFGFGEVYTGMPVEGVEGTGYDSGGDRGDEPIKPADPETGQCPEGYIFDEDLQACRLDTGGVAAASAASQTFAPGAYARMSLLDQAPQGLLQVSGQPYDFDAANRAFRMASATRPEYYSDPYDLTGYTLLA